MKLICSKCHIAGDIGCNCGVKYLLRADGLAAAAAVAAVADPANVGKSNRTIARETGVSRQTVDRARSADSGPNGPDSAPTKTERAAAAIQANPEKSNRAIARELSIDPETVRQARKRMGAEPKASEARRASRPVGPSEPTYEQGYQQGRQDRLCDPDIYEKLLSVDDQKRLQLFFQACENKFEKKYQQDKKKLETERQQDKKKLRAEYDADAVAYHARKDAEYKLHMEEILPTFNEKYAQYNMVINSHKGVFSPSDYKKILACLHPDRIQDPVLKQQNNEAFRIFNEKRVVLQAEKEKLIDNGGLPKTRAEWEEAARKTTERRRANARARTSAKNAVMH